MELEKFRLVATLVLDAAYDLGTFSLSDLLDILRGMVESEDIIIVTRFLTMCGWFIPLRVEHDLDTATRNFITDKRTIDLQLFVSMLIEAGAAEDLDRELLRINPRAYERFDSYPKDSDDPHAHVRISWIARDIVDESVAILAMNTEKAFVSLAEKNLAYLANRLMTKNLEVLEYESLRTRYGRLVENVILKIEPPDELHALHEKIAEELKEKYPHLPEHVIREAASNIIAKMEDEVLNKILREAFKRTTESSDRPHENR